jgi:hypothetical protein
MDFKTFYEQYTRDTYYHGSSLKGLTELRASQGGELGKGVYITKNKDLAVDFTKDDEHNYTGEVYEVTINTNLKETDKDDYLTVRSHFYDKLQSENGGEWGGIPMASEAEQLTQQHFIDDGYGGLYVEEEHQGIVFNSDDLSINQQL